MTVSELVAELSRHPGDAEVVVVGTRYRGELDAFGEDYDMYISSVECHQVHQQDRRRRMVPQVMVRV